MSRRHRHEHNTVTPRPGLALFFEHMLRHAGVKVTSGTKYVLRSDVMYYPDIRGERL